MEKLLNAFVDLVADRVVAKIKEDPFSNLGFEVHADNVNGLDEAIHDVLKNATFDTSYNG